MNYLSSKTIFQILILAILAYGCGGGGGGDTNNSNDDNTQNNISLNQGLEGYLFFEQNDSAFFLNAELGTYFRVPNTYWDRNDTVFDMPESAKFSVRPVFNDHTEFVIRARNCYHSFGDISTCIVIQDYSGKFHEQFSTWDKISVPQLSPDRKHIAMFRNLSDDWLEIYTRSGDLVSSSRVDDNNFAWLSTGRLIYVNGRRFVFTFPGSTEAEYNLELPSEVAPGSFIGIFAVSPDEARIVFNLVTSDYSKPYIMNIDGTGIRQLADVPQSYSYKVINEPQWSPNGKWILLKQGISAVSGGAQGTLPYLFIVPSNVEDKILILSANDSERSKEVRSFYRYDSFDNRGPITNRALSNTTLFWIP
ncbi:MAG: hypothetical protein K1562_19095 [Candidatus Thiodiazotropha sp. (ex. Lucinisca nassula)]|nr:hypothetical protein [Candidatus Thiodiazotropha sp. (ex. Lucinisca nassula)]